MVKRALDRLEEGAVALLLAAMTVVTFAAVVARYVFNSGATWALEFTEFCFIWLIFLGASYAVRVHAHIGVDTFVKLLPPGGQRLAGLIGAAGCVAYGGILLAGSLTYFGKIYAVGIEAQDLPVPLWVPLLVMPFSLALITWRFAQVFWRIATGRQMGLNLMDEAAESVRQIDDGGAPS